MTGKQNNGAPNLVAISRCPQKRVFYRENAFPLVVDVFTRTKVPVHIKFSVYMIRSNIKDNVFFKRSYKY